MSKEYSYWDGHSTSEIGAKPRGLRSKIVCGAGATAAAIVVLFSGVKTYEAVQTEMDAIRLEGKVDVACSQSKALTLPPESLYGTDKKEASQFMQRANDLICERAGWVALSLVNEYSGKTEGDDTHLTASIINITDSTKALRIARDSKDFSTTQSVEFEMNKDGSANLSQINEVSTITVFDDVVSSSHIYRTGREKSNAWGMFSNLSNGDSIGTPFSTIDGMYALKDSKTREDFMRQVEAGVNAFV